MWGSIWWLIGGVGTVVSALGILPMALDMMERRGKRLHTKFITDPEDPDLIGIWELQAETFSTDVADDLEQIRHWVVASRNGAREDDHHFTFVLLALKKDQTICGYLYAYYYESTRVIFLAYIVVVREKLTPKEAYDASLMLLRDMFRVCNDTGYLWESVVTEVEVDLADEKKRLAKAKLARFQSAARKLSEMAKRPPVEVYKLPITYRQPVLRLEDLGKAAENPINQWLLYAPRAEDHLEKEGDKVYLSREDAAKVIESVLLYSYADTFKNSPEYQAYIRTEYEQYLKALPERLELIKDRKAI